MSKEREIEQVRRLALLLLYIYLHMAPLVWESEEWLKQHVKPLSESGGVKGKLAGNQPGVNGGEEALKEREMEE
jgi:hypothetical protein